MCPNSGYANHIYELTSEICNRYDVVDGLFYDICFGPLCWCDSCKKGMLDAGLNPENEEDAKTYHRIKWQKFAAKCGEILKEIHPEATIFFNGGAEPSKPEWHSYPR